MNTLSRKEIMLVSLMLFSMFFGAGNLIFPPFLGQAAGENVILSLIGFIVSAVGLPILGVAAIAKAGSFEILAGRVHPLFALIFPFIIYVSIGPGLAIPRAGSLAFEMGIAPFLPGNLAANPFSLLLYTIVFFGLVFWFSMSPSKLVNRFGKLLTPLLLSLIALIFVKSLITPIGSFEAPSGNYAASPVFAGFLDGYLTMDALAALVFGIVIANTVRSKGVEDSKKVSLYMIYAGIGAGLLLTTIYCILGFLGAASGGLGEAENGAQILTNVMNSLFGQSGAVLLGVIFTLACLCVCIGLVISCSQYFASTISGISYKMWVTILSLLSMGIANLGLTQILQVSVPILGAIYPVAIVLIALALLHNVLKGYSSVYVLTVALVGIFSVADMINQTFLSNAWSEVFMKLPLYEQGVGWLVLGIIGIIVGYLIGKINSPRNERNTREAA
ncbi:branched-chain amino acid transport system II carrier protein [Bacillus taeanensis]|uniref:Branched-chain amino acid transport system carrier protein n=1 Tax=Bacillus taeanensis TaxID=273032 RepID=A0A366XTH4_9BACI|nr:branched-chain amino acid transport system II carrier protein [Bacillus taeanensis]RBW68049.1 branched-chain amino acid transport system II carrier protein [Bacillus taeanensis]